MTVFKLYQGEHHLSDSCYKESCIVTFNSSVYNGRLKSRL